VSLLGKLGRRGECRWVEHPVHPVHPKRYSKRNTPRPAVWTTDVRSWRSKAPSSIRLGFGNEWRRGVHFPGEHRDSSYSGWSQSRQKRICTVPCPSQSEIYMALCFGDSPVLACGRARRAEIRPVRNTKQSRQVQNPRMPSLIISDKEPLLALGLLLGQKISPVAAGTGSKHKIALLYSSRITSRLVKEDSWFLHV
jgi:hypothetical protein